MNINDITLSNITDPSFLIDLKRSDLRTILDRISEADLLIIDEIEKRGLF